MPLKLETGPPPSIPPSENLAAQVDRILHSNTLRGSETLRNLLQYLCSCAIEAPSRTIKVREIAMSVFGRAEDFDAQADSIVRVHTGRLRSKLADYYLGEGAQDYTVVSIPRGSYNLVCDLRLPGQAPPVEAQLAPTVPEVPPPVVLPVRKSGRSSWIVAAAALILGGLGAQVLRNTMEDARVPAPLRTFWRPFTATPGAPVIVFSNLTLADHGLPVADTYTTNGEVMGVFAISRMLSIFHKSARAKPGGLLTWDDAKDNDLVFVGGPLAETPLRDLALFKEFQFKQGAPGEAGSIVNVHPEKGEAAVYVGDSARPRRFDYALIALGTGLDPKHEALALAGIDYYGTQAATEWVTRGDKMQELLTRLRVSPGSGMPWFEALIYTKINGGVPVHSEIVIVRAFNSSTK